MITYLLLDIEGTTTPIEFVHLTLFSYARVRAAEYMRDELTNEDLRMLKAEYDADSNAAKPAWKQPPTEFLLWLMDNDRKSRSLKIIQGKMWEAGYRSELLKGRLYQDVVPSLHDWKSRGRKIFIFSSGSVLAQRLLFEYSTEGDLSGLIDGYFDTEIGPKQGAVSYSKIAEKIGCHASEMLFISDRSTELDAAHAAGCHVLLSVRTDTEPQETSHRRIESFEDVNARIRDFESEEHTTRKK